jgi:hypothetical protein
LTNFFGTGRAARRVPKVKTFFLFFVLALLGDFVTMGA